MISSDEVKKWHKKCTVNRLIDNLKKRGFKAYYAENKAEALKIILNLIPEKSTVGIGGSITIRELNLIEELEARKIKVVHHWIRGLSRSESFNIRRQEVATDIFISSCNAVTIDGKIVCVDAVGNRVAALSFGPKKVIIAAGINKITSSIEEAMWRIRNIATPMNAKRLNLKIPCAEKGYCTNCNQPECPCKITLIIEGKPNMTDFHVIIVGEELGF